jgi:hypothetical protein
VQTFQIRVRNGDLEVSDVKPVDHCSAATICTGSSRKRASLNAAWTRKSYGYDRPEMQFEVTHQPAE